MTSHTDQSAARQELVRLAYAMDKKEAEEMIALLAQSGIPASEGEGIRDLYALGGPMGIEVRVPSDRIDQAAAILKGAGKAEGSLTDPSQAQPTAGRKTLVWLLVCAILIVCLFLVRVLLLKA